MVTRGELAILVAASAVAATKIAPCDLGFSLVRLLLMAWSHERVNRAIGLSELVATCDHLLAAKNQSRELKFT